MTRHETIIAGRKPRPVRVERRRKPRIAACWSRHDVHRIGLAAVADELGVASLLPMGGIMHGERLRALLGGKGVRSENRGNRGSGGKSSSPINASAEDLKVGEPDRNSHVSDTLCLKSDAQVLQKAPQNMTEIMPGALADDVSRHIWAERGRFSEALWLGGAL